MQQILYTRICDDYIGKALRKNTVMHIEMCGIKIFPKRETFFNFQWNNSTGHKRVLTGRL